MSEHDELREDARALALALTDVMRGVDDLVGVWNIPHQDRLRLDSVHALLAKPSVRALLEEEPAP